MSRKSATAPAVPVVTTPVIEAPKPIEIPHPDKHPDVIERREHYATLNAKLKVAIQQRKSLESELATRAGESDDELEARLMARGLPTDKLTTLRELRRSEGVIAKAMELVTALVKKSRDDAVREITPKVRSEVFIPAVREAVKDWLDTVRKAEKFRRLVEDIQRCDVGSGTYCPFNQPVPLTLADPEWFKSFVADLISNGFTDAETVKAALPDLL